jgi:hypothetical protein|tara:strand:- start:1028 stop:1216 length:189 start_codon:yes stop_codon:yes gene_type:complete
MSDYNNKKKYRKQKARDRAAKARARKRGDAEKAKNREEKTIERIKWQVRPRISPIRKVVDEE